MWLAFAAWVDGRWEVSEVHAVMQVRMRGWVDQVWRKFHGEFEILTDLTDLTVLFDTERVRCCSRGTDQRLEEPQHQLREQVQKQSETATIEETFWKHLLLCFIGVEELEAEAWRTLSRGGWDSIFWDFQSAACILYVLRLWSSPLCFYEAF